MAGDWIKMRGNLWDDPRVSRLCDLTGQSEAAVIGGLYWLWSSADQHTETGVMPGLSTKAIDRKTGVSGLADALIEIGWLADHPEGVRIVNFEEHNGASAKRRMLDAKRKATVRKVSASEADKPETTDGQSAPNCGAREEKRREEKKSPPNPPSSGKPDMPGFDRFWSAWPKTERKVAKAECRKRWGRRGLEAKADAIVAHVVAMKATKLWRDGFEPAPLTYLNQSRWLDGEAEQAPSDAPWYVRAGFGDEHSAVAAGAKPEVVA